MVIKQIDENFGLFTFFLFLLIINISEYFCEYNHEYEIETDFNYPRKLRLNNGNYLVMTGSGIYLYNDDFTLKKDIITFGAYLIRNNPYIYSNDMAQFLSEDGGYVICIMLNETYIISKSGDFLYNFDIEYSKFREGNQIIPYGHSGNNHYFVIMKSKESYIYIRNYIYDSLNNRVDYEGCYNYSIGFQVYPYLSCELMKNSNNEKVIFCFFGEWNGIYYVVFDTDEFKPIDNYKGKINIDGIGGGQLFVTNINSLTRKTVACCTQRISELNCFGYNIDINNFTPLGQITGGDCKQENINLKIDFFPETEEFFIGCKSETIANKYYLGKLNSNNDFVIYGEYTNVIPSDSCTSTDLFNFIYTSGKYSIVTDSPYCQDQRVVQLIGADKIREYPTNEPSVIIRPPCNGYLTYDTNECHSNIIDGYFYNDTSSNIIYKCHPNCKTCNESGTNDNNNCLTCPDNIYLDFKNCVSSCGSRGYFTDPENSAIKRCNCSNTKCLYCTLESLSYENELCKSCNIDRGYYPKENDNLSIGPFINCYHNPEGYYFDNNIYKKCYSTCHNCNGYGDSSYNNCIDCINNNYILLTDFNKNNCYEKCFKYYYFDESHIYHCDDTCPENYKRIDSTNKCIDKCSNTENNKYEYNKICYESCPSKTYYNYNHTICLTEIPPGYYINSSQARTIDKCHPNCKTCNESGTDDNNNCLTCPDTDTIYLDFKNCVSSCGSRGSFTDPQNSEIERCKCSNTKCLYCTEESLSYDNNLCLSCNNDGGYFPKKDDIIINELYINCYNNDILSEGYYFNNNEKRYEPCYSSCKRCNELGVENNHKCTECISNYEFILNNDHNENCYETCSYYYYFNKSNNYKYECTADYHCPDGYKLINSTNKCIDDCSNDNIFNCKYEFKNVCYEKLICEYYYNYDKTSCLLEPGEGYYCNSTIDKTIDKCHPNCKTCNENGTDENNNCLACKNNKIFDLGNCRDICEHGTFIDNNDSIEKCKCTKNISCEYCSKESNEVNLCLTCNKDEGYYIKIDDEERSDGFINCYNEPDGYYLDINIYRPCYSSCKKCTGQGSIEDNQCTECKQGFEFKNDFENDNNCYNVCEHYYYYESNEYKCTDQNSCPESFPKLISNKKRCIDNCTKDNLYQYEYNNNCISSCGTGTHIKPNEPYVCEGDLNCELNNTYYNYFFTYCTEEVEEGYYCNNTSLKTVDKCHTNCKTCNESGTDENNNCLACKDNKIFDLGNCRDTCEHGTFIDNNDSIEKCKCTKNISCEYCSKESNEVNLCLTCNKDEGYYIKIDDEERNDGFINCYKNPEGYYLDTNIYKPCYFSCKSCNESGTIKDNKCIECNEGYEFKNDFEKDNNCYNICEYNYYYDSSKNYICTDNDACPDDFAKLIKEKKRCVDDCYNYNLIEYNNTCFEICPNGTHVKNDICIDDLNCEFKGKYYNYEQTECIDKVTPGYYCNNTSLNTIDKCHLNCKTCEKGGTNDNNNCLSCPDTGTKYFDLGNCRETCNNGYFVENSINKCKCSTNITCQFCSKESAEFNLCDSCNTEKGYYPKYNDDKNIAEFINCYNDTNINCTHYYYFNYSNSKYYCTENTSCPDGYNFLIKEKRKCVDNCIKDNDYKYLYENKCYKSCPKKTENSKNNKFICEPCKEENTDSQILLNEVDKLIDNFPVKNISCENNQVKEEDNENYKIYIYINNNCSYSNESEQNIPDVDFGECYNIIKEENEIEEELIVSKVLVKKNNTSVYSFYNPNTLVKLDSTPCKNQTITLQKDFFNIIDKKFDDSQKETILHLLNQGINVLNNSHRFYTDLCYHYESLNGRDIPIKVRLSFYPENITLCEEGCQSVGINLKTLKAKCECTFIDIMNMNIINDNPYGKAVQEILEAISKLNIDVVKCFKDIFNTKYFSKNEGGFIMIGLFLGQISCFIKYAIDGLYFIRKYIFNLTSSYTEYMDKNGNELKKNVNMPPKKIKRKKSRKGVNILDLNINNSSLSKNGLLHSNNAQSKKIFFDSTEKRNSSNNKAQKLLINSNKIVKINSGKPKKNLMLYKNQKIQNNIKITINEIKKEKIDMKEYLSLSFDENDYDDVIEKEKRTFCYYFCDKFQMNQIFINSFFKYEPFRPKSLKILVLIMTIELYFVINAIYYDEEYLTDLYYSKEEDKFYSFIPRRINAFIYTSAVSGIISYFVGYFFVEENKIKKIFRRNKEGDIKMKYEISMMIKDMQNKFTTLIIISLVLTVICFVYISCFNNVYRYIKKEWIKSSLFILILMQIINFLMTLIECSFRYIAIKCKSEKLFRLSIIIAL